VHLVALFCTPRGHAYVKELWFRFHDMKDGVGQLLQHRLTKTPPPTPLELRRKGEYWSLVWGRLS
jgi:hypothetical protein